MMKIERTYSDSKLQDKFAMELRTILIIIWNNCVKDSLDILYD